MRERDAQAGKQSRHAKQARQMAANARLNLHGPDVNRQKADEKELTGG